jgi:hypothetical protein
MMPIAHSSRYTTVLNPPNLAGFGAAADIFAEHAALRVSSATTGRAISLDSMISATVQ